MVEDGRGQNQSPPPIPYAMITFQVSGSKLPFHVSVTEPAGGADHHFIDQGCGR